MSHKLQALAVLTALRACYLKMSLISPLLHDTCYRLLTDSPDIDSKGIAQLDKSYNELINATIPTSTAQHIIKCRNELIKEYHLEEIV